MTKKAEKRACDNITPILTNCETGLEEMSIDVILLYDVIHLIKEPDNVLKELWRVLRKDGTLSVTCPHMKRAALVQLVEQNSAFRLEVQLTKTLSFKKSKDKTNQKSFQD